MRGTAKAPHRAALPTAERERILRLDPSQRLTVLLPPRQGLVRFTNLLFVVSDRGIHEGYRGHVRLEVVFRDVVALYAVRAFSGLFDELADVNERPLAVPLLPCKLSCKLQCKRSVNDRIAQNPNEIAVCKHVNDAGGGASRSLDRASEDAGDGRIRT